MDHFRLAVGGTQLLENSFVTSELCANQAIPDMTIKWDVWPRDVKIRRNMSTSEWFDLTELIRSNDARVVENRDQAPGGSAEPVWLTTSAAAGLPGQPSGAQQVWSFCLVGSGDRPRQSPGAGSTGPAGLSCCPQPEAHTSRVS